MRRNSKSEVRNPKQIRNSNAQMTWTRVGKLGLIGSRCASGSRLCLDLAWSLGGVNWVCFGFVFSGGVECVLFIILCSNSGCVGFGVLKIGFVLRKRGQYG